MMIVNANGVDKVDVVSFNINQIKTSFFTVSDEPFPLPLRSCVAMEKEGWCDLFLHLSVYQLFSFIV